MDCIPYINDLKIELDMLEDALHDCRDEKEYQNIMNLIETKKNLMEKYKDNLSKLSNNQICYRIYLKILNGLNPTRAVEEIAEENYQKGIKPTDIPYIFTKYYKKIKEYL